MSFTLVHVAACTLFCVLVVSQFSTVVDATFPALALPVLPTIKKALQVKGCDHDQDIKSNDDQTLTGIIVVKDCSCEKIFTNDAWRIAAVEDSVTTALQAFYQKRYNTKINYVIHLQVIGENSTYTSFNFTVKVPKADHDKVRPCIQNAWNHDQVKKTIEQASVNQPNDDQPGDSDSAEPAQYTCNPKCKNRGTCTSKNTCTCKSGFSGATCEIESAGLCTFTDKPILLIDFGAGSSQYSKAKPSDFSFSTTYQQQVSPVTSDGNFSFVNSVHDDFQGAWHTGAKDHTGNTGGYMFLVNADYRPGQFYNGTVDNLSIGQRYEFSVYVANLMVPSGIQPNILFEVRSPTLGNRLLAQLSSGNIPQSKTMTWVKYGFSFIAPSNLVTLLMISNAPGGYGNDLAIDDIALRACVPNGGSDSSPSAQPTCDPKCENGGTCTSTNTCTCTSGFSGAACEIESAGLCTFTDKPIFSIDFGAGSSQYSKAKPSDFSFSTTYEQQIAPVTNDGNFSFVNSVHDDFQGSWHTGAKDHTGNTGGYMFLVNADYRPGQFYNGTVDNLSIGSRYEFSVYVANLMVKDGILPNILFEVRSPTLGNRLLAQLTSGNIPKSNDMTWLKYGLSFKAPSSSVTLLMISNAPGGYGNDLAIDDIALRVCVPSGKSDSGPSAAAATAASTTAAPTTAAPTTAAPTTAAPTTAAPTTAAPTTAAPTTAAPTTAAPPAAAIDTASAEVTTAADSASAEVTTATDSTSAEVTTAASDAETVPTSGTTNQPDTAVLASQCANCKQYNYELQGKSLIHDHSYTCNDNPKNIAAGYCILSFNDAVQHCDRDPECGGFDITTNVTWRSLFERNGLPSVQLFRKGSATNANVEWSSYLKTGSK